MTRILGIAVLGISFLLKNLTMYLNPFFQAPDIFPRIAFLIIQDLVDISSSVIRMKGIFYKR